MGERASGGEGRTRGGVVEERGWKGGRDGEGEGIAPWLLGGDAPGRRRTTGGRMSRDQQMFHFRYSLVDRRRRRRCMASGSRF